MLTALNLSPSKLHTPLDVLEGEKWEGASIGAARRYRRRIQASSLATARRCAFKVVFTVP